MRALVLVFAACMVPAAGAQPWSGLRSKNPPGVEVSLRLIDPHGYRQGEVIRVEMKWPGWVPGPAPPAEQWQFAGLLLEPEQGCGSVAKPCFLDSGLNNRDFSRIINGLNGPVTEHNDTVLNRWLPPLAPGHYRAALLARSLRRTNGGPYLYAEPAQYAVSGMVEFEVVAATPEWTRQTIAASVGALKGAHPATQEAYDARDRAAQQLRFLDDPAAWQASLSLLPEEEGTLLQGLESTRQPERVCELIQTRIPAPEQSVTSRYLWTVQQVCARAHLPPPPPPQGPAGPLEARISATPPPAAAAPPIDPAMEAYLRKLGAYQAELGEKSAGALAASLSAQAGRSENRGLHGAARIRAAAPESGSLLGPGADSRIHRLVAIGRYAGSAASARPVREHDSIARGRAAARIGPRPVEARRLLRRRAFGAQRVEPDRPGQGPGADPGRIEQARNVARRAATRNATGKRRAAHG